MKPRHLLLFVMLVVCSLAMAQSVEVHSYDVGKFLKEHGQFRLYPINAKSKKKGIEEKYAISCDKIGGMVSLSGSDGSDGNIWELEDAGNGTYYIKNTKGCYLPDGSDNKDCIGKGKGKAIKAKFIYNVCDKEKGFLIEDSEYSHTYFHNVLGMRSSYSLKKQAEGYLQEPTFMFFFVTLDGKTIDDVPGAISYDFKYKNLEELFKDKVESESEAHKEPWKVLVDRIMDTKDITVQKSEWKGSDSGYVEVSGDNGFQFLRGLEAISIEKISAPIIKRMKDLENLGLEKPQNEEQIRDSIFGLIRDYAVSKLPELIEKRDSITISTFAWWLCSNRLNSFENSIEKTIVEIAEVEKDFQEHETFYRDNGIEREKLAKVNRLWAGVWYSVKDLNKVTGIDCEFNTRWTWPAVKALTKVIKPIDGYYNIRNTTLSLDGEDPHRWPIVEESFKESRTCSQWSYDIMAKFQEATGLDLRYRNFDHKKADYEKSIDESIIYSSKDDRLYIGFYLYPKREYVNDVVRFYTDHIETFPIEESKFVGVELNEAALLGKEEPIYHYLGKQSFDMAVNTIKQKAKNEDQIQEARREQINKEQTEKLNAQARQHRAALVRKYGEKAVNAIVENDQPYVGMPAGILSEYVAVLGDVGLLSGWKVLSSYGGRTVYGKGRRRCTAVNGKVTAVYTE